MSDLSKRFEYLLAETAVIPPGSRVLVAVSGGADSVALLLLLYEAAGRFSLQLEAGHLDHALRPESGADAEFVQELCSRLGIALHSERCDIAETAKAQKGNLEEVARMVRRDFLRTVARSRQCGLIALGHHRDDQVETFLLRLLRGAGPTGLSGMRMLSAEFVRP
ncbi:MAG: tRNA lysidine(34) synthetase TilS, partial [Desulfuromonadales bacterium]